MKYISFFIKFFYRIRYWVILVPLIIASLVYWKTKHRPNLYTSDCTIYTGIITGVSILSESGVMTNSFTQGSMLDNLLNIITSDQTLKQVSLRLYARIMVHGDLNEDNIYINANHYRVLYDHGKVIHHLIDKSSPNDSINEANTFRNLVNYETNDNSNYVYGIYQWFLPYVNRSALQKIIVERMGSSDMLRLSYTTDDPGVTYQTLNILVDEFIKQYQELRFGETNKVIAYFRAELARLAQELENAENDLTGYRTEKKVINYDEETRGVAALNRDYELQYWTSKNTYTVSDSLIQELEKRMNLNTEIIKNNNLFILYNNRISEINEKLAMARYYSENALPQVTRDSLNKELKRNKEALSEAIQKMGTLKYSKEGISNNNVIEEWLNQILTFKKAEAELKVLQDRKEMMASKYIHFAPIGSTLARKERNIVVNEKQYMAILDALNAAILRQKNLQMTSSTLKPMNDPYFPLNAATNPHKKIVIGAALAALVFTIFFFLIIEILDRTLQTKFKAEQLTGSRVLGTFCRPLSLKSKRLGQIYSEQSARTLCNYLITYFKPKGNNIINIISNQPGEGKSYIAKQLTQEFAKRGMEVVLLSWNDKSPNDIQLHIQSLYSDSMSQTATNNLDNKIFLVEYPSLKEAGLTPNILQDADINLQIIDSRRTWKDTDQLLFERTKEMSARTPLFIALNYTSRDTAEDVNGLMPPYTFFRKLFYQLSQLGLTAKDKIA